MTIRYRFEIMKIEKRNSRMTPRGIILWVFVIGCLSPVWSDIVTLENGSDIFGEVTLEGEKTVKMKTPAGNLEFPRDRVVKISRESLSVTYGKFGKYYLDRKEFSKAVGAYEKALESD